MSISDFNCTCAWWRIVLQDLQREIGIKGCAGSGGGEQIAECELWWSWRGRLITWRYLNIAVFSTFAVRGVRVDLLSGVLPRIRLRLLLSRCGGIGIEALVWRRALIGIGALVDDRISVDWLFVGRSDQPGTPAKRSWCGNGANDQGDQSCGHKPRGALSLLHVRSVAGVRASSVARLRRVGRLT